MEDLRSAQSSAQQPKGCCDVVLFMAIDIVGSAEFKLQFRDNVDEAFWLGPFESFFRWTPLRFIGRIAQAYAHVRSLPKTDVWRVRGDEIIFLSRLSRPDDAHLLTDAFMLTLRDCSDVVLRDWDLKVRGCCWAAQMSGRNRVITIPEMHDGFLDYLGPDVDAGFRLSSCAPDGHVAYSYNLIHLFASVAGAEKYRFRYDEDRMLKGVVDQLPYPIVTSCATASSDPEAFPFTASAIVEKVNSGHPAATPLNRTLLRF